MKEIGIEKEMFLLDQNGVLQDPSRFHFPIDACGYLVELRGKPATNPFDAFYLMQARTMELAEKVTDMGLVLNVVPFMDKRTQPAFFRNISRRFGKNPATSCNLYGKTLWDDCYAKAGVHIHFSDSYTETVTTTGGPRIIKHSKQLDIPSIVRGMDLAFADEIKVAKRIPGEYELKDYGFEYRSLPNNVDLLAACKLAFQLF